MPDTGDVYVWRATLDDGSSVAEFDDDGTEHGWAEVPSHRVVAVALLPRREGLPPVGVAVDQALGTRPVFRKVRGIPLLLSPDGPPEEGEPFVFTTVVGWEREVGGETVRCLACCLDDGRVILSDRDLV